MFISVVEFEEDGVGSFRSLLLKNLLKLIALSVNDVHARSFLMF
jgi:hypothetical protein